MMILDRMKLASVYLTGRMAEYEAVLMHARDHGYQLLSLYEYLQKGKPAKCIILRHDIDFRSSATVKMLDLEQRYGASASYYFRHETMDHELMRYIQSKGSEVSLHYETLAIWALQHGIMTKEQLALTDWKQECIPILAREIRNLRALGFPCRTIASHGNPHNDILLTANYFLFYDEDFYLLLDIDLEAYDKQFISELDVYITDGNPACNRGWFYGLSPQEAIQMGKNRILLLTHPHHWIYFPIRIVLNIAKAIYYGHRTIPSRFELE